MGVFIYRKIMTMHMMLLCTRRRPLKVSRSISIYIRIYINIYACACICCFHTADRQTTDAGQTKQNSTATSNTGRQARKRRKGVASLAKQTRLPSYNFLAVCASICLLMASNVRDLGRSNGKPKTRPTTMLANTPNARLAPNKTV
jgi:hypothetical protein